MSDIRDSVNSMASLGSTRSLLFVPGSDERKLAKALGAGADADHEERVDATGLIGLGAPHAFLQPGDGDG